MLSWFGYFASLIAVVIALVQWYIKFPDPSQLVFGLNIALTIVICAYCHSAFRNLGNDLTKSNETNERKNKELNNALDVAINYTREVEGKIKEK